MFIDSCLVLESQTIAGKLSEKLPINKTVDFDPELLVAAMELGMIIVIRYVGAKQKNPYGMERTIYPLIWGTFKDPSVQYLRAFHLTGWSVSKRSMVVQSWRMFRIDRIKSITLTGTFFKVPPKGFKPDSPGFPNVIKMVDFYSIIKRQSEYFASKKERKEAEIEKRYPIIEVVQTGKEIDFSQPYIVDDIKKDINTNITFLRKIDNTRHIAIDGVGGALNGLVEVVNSNISMGIFKIIKIVNGLSLSDIESIDGKTKIEFFRRI